ncbi:S-type pyocin domain-containing protein [Lelliottia sp. V89_10]|uniref:S-type pyocin domain-containing protein n=1 Tax=Lelliottia wanjuensis TaxID=3050585 RepID=UPI00249DB1A3|nr:MULTISPECIES: S-type pyocin domain-containing protein [unclassified Lelliottia]MDI3360048.1 S-type pyocin domain-containing protein [Lelliottia sp. V89_13]MDK9548274.1 S-type pyocin domain-containing protein [Lelliottia sp. V89_5]MDK9594886.1 S-type pyocin domain-containing protein [Lelliottia sp. V89_10]
MSQVLGMSSARTSAAPKEPVVVRLPAKVFFASASLSSSAEGTVVMGATETALGRTIAVRAGAAAATVGEGLTLNPFTVLIMGLFYTPSLGNSDLPPDQLYQNLINGQLMVGAFTRATGTVAQQDYVPEEELREIAGQKGSVRTQVRLRVEVDPQTGEKTTKSYQVGEGSGLDRVRVRFAKRIDDKTWSFEDPSLKGTLIWSTDTGQGRFVKDGNSVPVQMNPSTTNETTVHEGGAGGYTSPPTPIPEPVGVWGLPNPAPEPLPPIPGTPVPDEQRPNIETFPIEDRDFDDFIIVDPIGNVPAIYVYFQKLPVENLEVDYYGNFNGRSRQGEYEVDHIPSKAAVRLYLKEKYPHLRREQIDKMIDRVASVAIPKEVHQKCSETYGGRNNRQFETEGGEIVKQKELDANDLEAAVNANWDANAECLRNDYGVSDEKLEEVRAKLHELNRQSGLY